MKVKTWHVVGGSALATAVALGAHFEGERLLAYLDVGGTPTICDGETKGVFMGMTATHAQCQAWLTQGMQQRLQFVDDHLIRKESDGTRAALADFAYNEGEERLLKSSAFRLINLGELQKGCEALKLYDIAGGQVQAGLVKRREAEYELCVGGQK